MSKRKFKIAAVVDVGLDNVNMKIAQTDENDSLIEMEWLQNDIEFLNYGIYEENISFDAAEVISDILHKYYKLTDEYKIPREYVLAYATDRLPDAPNKHYIIDQINIKTNREITLFDDTEEKTQVFKEMKRRIEQFDKNLNNYLMVFFCSDLIGICAVVSNNIVFYKNLDIKTVLLTGHREETHNYTLDEFKNFTEEYIEYIIAPVKEDIKDYDIKNIVFNSKEIDELLDHEKDQSVIKPVDVKRLLEDGFNNNEQSSTKLSIDENEKKLFAEMTVLKKLIGMTQINEVLSLKITLSDCLLYQLLYKKQSKEEKKEFDENIISSAKFMAEKYNYDKKHSEKIEEFALIIFDNLKKVHGFSRRERIYLQTAAILHDIGRYVNESGYDTATANIIRSSSIISLNYSQKNLVSNIARYHGNDIPTQTEHYFNLLTDSQKMIAAKLSAILRLADSLDCTHLQKIKSINPQLQDKRLKIIADTNKNTTLEEIRFESASHYFKQVFGIECELIKKGML